MVDGRVVVPGTVRNGVVVPNAKSCLPEGASVQIVLSQPETSADLQAEFEAWDALGDEAWAMIDKWEKEGRP